MATSHTTARSRTAAIKKRPRRRLQKKRPRDVKFASRQRGVAQPDIRPNTGQVRTDTKRAIAGA